MSNPNVNRKVIHRPPLFDTDAVTYFNSVTTPFSNARKVIINDFIKGVKADGNWPLLDRIWVLASEATDQSVISLVNPSSAPLLLVNSPTFEVSRGYTGNAINSYINTQFAPTQGTNYTLNSASFGGYFRTEQQSDNADMASMRSAAIASYAYLRMRDTTNLFSSYANSTGGAGIGKANSISLGMSSVVRTSSGSYTYYKNGVSLGSVAQSSTGLSEYSAYILSANLAGVATTFSNKQVSLFYFGSGAINEPALFARVNTLMTAIGANV